MPRQFGDRRRRAVRFEIGRRGSDDRAARRDASWLKSVIRPQSRQRDRQCLRRPVVECSPPQRTCDAGQQRFADLLRAPGPFASRRRTSNTTPDRSIPSGQSSARVWLKTCSHLSIAVSGASGGKMRVQSASPAAPVSSDMSANKRRTRSCEIPFTRTSARAAALCPSRPATALVPCTKCTGMFASRESASTWSSKSAGLAAAIAISSGRAFPDASNSRIQRKASITSCCGLAHENRIGWAPLGRSTRISAFVSRSQAGTCRDPAIQLRGTTSLNARRRGRQHGDISLWP